MRPALISRTNRRGTTAPATALRFLVWTASDIWHPCCDPTPIWSALDPDCAENTCHDIEWDDRRWNGCAFSSPSYGVAYRALRSVALLTPLRTLDVLAASSVWTALRAIANHGWSRYAASPSR